MKFGDSRSNGFPDIRGADLVLNERTLAKPIPIARNAYGVLPKNQQQTENVKTKINIFIQETSRF